MELTLIAVLLCLGGVFAEPTITIMVSEKKAMPNDEVLFTCKIRNLAAEDMDRVLSIKKFVTYTDDNGEEKTETQDVANGKHPTSRYDGREFEIEEQEVGTNGWDYKLKIPSVRAEDSAHYVCSVAGLEQFGTELLEVYTKPDEVHFNNSLSGGSLEFAEGDWVSLACMAMGGVPVPRFELVVMDAGGVDDDKDTNYTAFFTKKESVTKLGRDCDLKDPQDQSCILFYTTHSTALAPRFRPDYTADGKRLTCKAYLEGSDMEPKSTSLTINMSYKPKFRCWIKHKVALHTRDYELTCRVLANPTVDEVKFEFMSAAGVKETLMPGDKAKNEDIQFMNVALSGLETEVTLKFDEVMGRHFDMDFKLVAENDQGSNSTVLKLVDESYIRGSASIATTGFFTIFIGLLSFIAL